MASLIPANSYERARQCQNAPDFGEAVTLARVQYRRMGSFHRRNGGNLAGTVFWQQQADDADAVLNQWKRLRSCPTARALFCLWLTRQGWCWYLAAFVEGTGEAFARELGY